MELINAWVNELAKTSMKHTDLQFESLTELIISVSSPGVASVKGMLPTVIKNINSLSKK
jgi:hypothetical protein